jgi:hypothetical protein
MRRIVTGPLGPQAQGPREQSNSGSGNECPTIHQCIHWSALDIEAPVCVNPGVALRHAALDLDRAANCIDDAWELEQDAVTGGLDDAAVVLRDLGIDELNQLHTPAASISVATSPNDLCIIWSSTSEAAATAPGFATSSTERSLL